MIVDSALYLDGARVATDVAKTDYAGLRRAVAEHPGSFVWVGLHEPTEAEMEAVASVFELDHLHVEDSLHGRQRPKLQPYEGGEGMLFLVLKTLWYVDEDDAVETGQVTLTVGPDFVVTVRQGEGLELHSARLDLERHTELLGDGPSAVVYAICDRVVDEYERVAAELETDVDELSDEVFSPARSHGSRRTYNLKRELSEMRRAVDPLREPMRRLAGGTVEGMAPGSARYFQDVADHVARVNETVNSLDSLLSSVFDAHLARVGLQQNEDMRRISAWVAIAAVGTLVAGIYGMNFDHMPELGWDYGYYAALTLMFGASVVLWRIFKRSGWL